MKTKGVRHKWHVISDTQQRRLAHTSSSIEAIFCTRCLLHFGSFRDLCFYWRRFLMGVVRKLIG